MRSLLLIGAWGNLEVPDVSRQGSDYGRNQAGRLMGRSVKGVFAVGCLHNSSAADALFSFCLCWRRAAVPVEIGRAHV